MRPVFKLFLPVLAVFVMPACAAINQQSATPTPIPSGLEIRGLFAGMTPCSVQAKLLFQIPARTDCEQMIWHLVLYQDPQTGVRNVLLLLSSPRIKHARVVEETAYTTQIAPTILDALDLNPHSLQAVRDEGVEALKLK